ncbi:hypothetical protein [Paenibacillus donghaensis]|uniref:hypothetical protein n=1 Tax=Paenibacillus donghaensis TaxID=414771 RepID=UPI002AD53802|nr:hypothetical protein [Paenibacillus donghaensis]
MLSGGARITAVDKNGKEFIDNVGKGDLLMMRIPLKFILSDILKKDGAGSNSCAVFSSLCVPLRTRSKS